MERQPKPARRSHPILSELRLRIRAIVPHKNECTCVFFCVAWITPLRLSNTSLHSRRPLEEILGIWNCPVRIRSSQKSVTIAPGQVVSPGASQPSHWENLSPAVYSACLNIILCRYERPKYVLNPICAGRISELQNYLSLFRASIFLGDI